MPVASDSNLCSGRGPVYVVSALDLDYPAVYLYEKTAEFVEKRRPPLKVKEEDEDLVDGPPFLNTQVLDKSVEP
jgi:hypothetical protein